MGKSLHLLSFFLGLVAATCQAQSTPVVAKQRIVLDELDSNGKVLRHSEILGNYFRNSAGAVLIQKYSDEKGSNVLRSGQLLDYDRHKTYTLDYQRHEAIERSDLSGPHGNWRHSNNALGEDTINGIQCEVRPIFQEQDGKRREIGRACVSVENTLLLKQDAILEPAGGPRTHQVIELYDISFVEPDQKEFALEKNFSILGKQPAAACNKPGTPSAPDPLK